MPDRPTMMNGKTIDELKKQDLSKVTEQRILTEQDNSMIYGALQIDVAGQIVDKFQHEQDITHVGNKVLRDEGKHCQVDG